MKRLILISLMFFAFVAMDAQKYYVCTGNSVYLRTGPGKNYAPSTYNFGRMEGRTIFLYKGTRLMYVGPTRNGYALVNAYHGQNGPGGYDQGWVATQYMRAEGTKSNVTKKTTKNTKNKKSKKTSKKNKR
ncbi:MAG: hypothetical protein J5629_07400 [Muribaculaceae bacterium]|nr:hypothetical protein [Muribaculaceae bacterium]